MSYGTSLVFNLQRSEFILKFPSLFVCQSICQSVCVGDVDLIEVHLVPVSLAREQNFAVGVILSGEQTCRRSGLCELEKRPADSDCFFHGVFCAYLYELSILRDVSNQGDRWCRLIDSALTQRCATHNSIPSTTLVNRNHLIHPDEISTGKLSLWFFSDLPCRTEFLVEFPFHSEQLCAAGHSDKFLIGNGSAKALRDGRWSSSAAAQTSTNSLLF